MTKTQVPQSNFDQKCLDLAEHFLPDDASIEVKYELASMIQSVVEMFCEAQTPGE